MRESNGLLSAFSSGVKGRALLLVCRAYHKVAGLFHAVRGEGGVSVRPHVAHRAMLVLLAFSPHRAMPVLFQLRRSSASWAAWNRMCSRMNPAPITHPRQ